MAARPRPIIQHASLLAAMIVVVACGGEPPPKPPSGPAPIEGAYALVLATQSTLITLAPNKAHVTCRPKPALKEFEFEGTLDGADAGKYLRFVLKDYTGPKEYRIDYTPGAADHKVEVGFPAKPTAAKSYKYKFFQYLRADINVTYRSHCDFSLQAEELTDRTRFSGSISCGTLWADFDSLDYLSQPLDGFADLIAKFECEQPT